MTRAFVSLFFIIFLGLTSSCTRSDEYEKDKGESSDEDARNYYDAPGSESSVTERVEMMGQPKKKIVVFNFWNDTPLRSNDLGPFGGNELRRSLFLTNRVIVPSDLRTQLETKDFIQDDDVRVAQLIREGRRMGVAVVVIGRIAKVVIRQKGDEVGLLRQMQSLAAVDIELKLFDVVGGREIAAIGGSGQSSNNSMVALEQGDIYSVEYRAELTKLAIRDAINGLTQEVLKTIEKMSWEGKIAKIAGNKVFVNSGRESGLVNGDILKVLTPGDEVYDPQTGAYLGTAQGQLKGTLEVVDFIGTDGAVAQVHSGGSFQEGDIVRLY